MRGVFIVTFLAVVLAGCSTGVRVAPAADALASVKTIAVQDRTGSVLLQASEATLISELVAVALKDRGYQTCRAPCEADATADVTVTTFANRTSVSRLHRLAVPVSVIAFQFQLRDRAGATLMDTRVSKKSDMAQRDLAAVLVQSLADKIPAAR